MKKIILGTLLILIATLTACEQEIVCGEGTILVEGECITTGVKHPGFEEEISESDTELLDFVDGSSCEVEITSYGVNDYSLVWEDEFSTNGELDNTKWEYMLGTGSNYGLYKWGNEEEQVYTKNLDNVEVKDGLLRITAKTTLTGYNSGRVRTKNKGDWQYGVIEVCAKIPDTLGTWPAIWMLPTDSPYGGWPYSGEIDIMEAVGFESNRVHFNIHTENDNWGTSRSIGSYSSISAISTTFHAYAIKWTETEIGFYVDGDLQFTYTPQSYDSAYWPFDTEFHLLLNIAVGGKWGGQRGIEDGTWEDHMYVDYVRVYQE